MSTILTFDLGTTLYKVALFNDSGRMIAVRRALPPIQSPQPGFVEVDPARFLKAISDACHALRSRFSGEWRSIAAISFATQANSFTLLDERNEPTMPIVLWSDQRAYPLDPELADISTDAFRGKTGMPRFGPALALAKIHWLRKTNSPALQRATKLCFLSDLLTLALTGLEMTEAGVAGLSGALDITNLDWLQEVLDASGLPPTVPPRVKYAGQPLGAVSREAAERLDLPESTFVLGCLDQYAGAIGTGAVEPGKMCETTGTVLAAVRCVEGLDPNPAPDVFQGPSFRSDRFFQMSFGSTSANLLEWYRKQLPGSFRERPSFDELSQLAANVTRAAPIRRFETNVEDCFTGAIEGYTRGEIVRGIMMTVCDALAEQVHALGGAPGSIRSAGGAARSDVWMQMKANRLNTTFEATECEEPTSLGAAILAASGLEWGSVEELAGKWVKVRRRFDPQ